MRMPKDQPLSLNNKEQGATAIEYGLIAALIAVAALTAMQAFSTPPDHHPMPAANAAAR